MDCEQYLQALIAGDPAADDHARSCSACARLRVATTAAPDPARATRALVRRTRSPRAAVLIAAAAALVLAALGARLAAVPGAPAPVPQAPAPKQHHHAVADAFSNPFADDPEDDFQSPTDLLTGAVPHRSHR